LSFLENISKTSLKEDFNAPEGVKMSGLIATFLLQHGFSNRSQSIWNKI